MWNTNIPWDFMVSVQKKYKVYTCLNTVEHQAIKACFTGHRVIIVKKDLILSMTTENMTKTLHN